MIKLSALPDFFPVLLLPIYWIFWLAFYLFYLPVYFFIWLFNPFRSKKTALAYYSRKAKRDTHLSEYSRDYDQQHASRSTGGTNRLSGSRSSAVRYPGRELPVLRLQGP